MNSVISYIKQNFLELIITFCILSNLFGFFLPHFLYYIALILLGIKMKEMGVKHNKNSSLFILFILLIVISSLINMMLDLRLVLFSFILILACLMALKYGFESGPAVYALTIAFKYWS